MGTWIDRHPVERGSVPLVHHVQTCRCARRLWVARGTGRRGDPRAFARTQRRTKHVKIIRDQIALDDLIALAAGRFGDLVKAVVDIDRNILAIDAELHADEEAALLDDSSRQAALWGINLYPADFGAPEWIEFDSMINVRPSAGNRSRSVEDPAIRERIVAIVERIVVA